MIVPGDTILIAGDSWGCGEWSGDNNPYRILHKGLEQYLIDYGCEVINLSVPGNKNLNSIYQLKYGIQKYNPSFSFWFQTDPIRDLRPYSPETFPKNLSELYDIQHHNLKKTYQLLSEIDMPIYCIGGVVDLDLDLLSYHNNLIPIIPSIIKMFGGPDIKFWISDWIDAKHLRFSDEFLSELEDHPFNTLPKEWFYPDGIHPNRLAHKQIFEHILAYHK